MRHKYIIIALSALLCVLFGIKAFLNHKETTTYPLQIDFMYLMQHSNSNAEPKIQFAVRDRINNECTNPLFFFDKRVKLGMSKDELEGLNLESNSIHFDSTVIPADVCFEYDKDNNLCAVGARFMMSSFKAAPTYILDLLGNRRVDITSDERIFHHMWYYKDSYFNFNYSTFSGDIYYYLKAATYTARTSRNLNELALYGGSYDHDFKKESYSSTSSSSSKTYKYGDSDTYQGSSKQAEDLAAIDAYFGF